MPRPKDRERLERSLVKLLKELRDCEYEEAEELRTRLEDSDPNTFEYERCMIEGNLRRLKNRRETQQAGIARNMELYKSGVEVIVTGKGETRDTIMRQLSEAERANHLKVARYQYADIEDIMVQEVEQVKKLDALKAKMARREGAQEVYA